MQAVHRALMCVLLWCAIGGIATAQESSTVTGLVTTRADGLPVPGAVVSVVGIDASATTDATGRYRLQLPRATAAGARLQLQVDAPGLARVTTDIVVTGPALTSDAALAPAFSETVTVGSRVAGSAAERAVPVDVITHDQIAASGFAETAQVLQSLAPSFNFPRPTITDGTDTVRPATLRGLGPDQVLVLINGKRRHQSALVHLNGSIGRGSTGVDLNAIPLSAIDHIEVLRDGAAAQYGSDAIAGVINIVLEERRGAAGDHVQLWIVQGRVRRQPMHRGWFVLQPRWGHQLRRWRTGRRGRLVGCGGRPGQRHHRGRVPAPQPDQSRLGRSPRPDRSRRCRQQPGAGAESSMGRPRHPRRDDVGERQRAARSRGDTVRLRLRRIQPPRRQQRGVLPACTRRPPRNWPQIYPLGFLPEIQPTVLDGSGTAGIRGVAGGWTYDGSGEYGRNSFDFTIGNTLNVSLGPSVPPNKTTFDAGALDLSQFVGNLDVSRGFRVPGFTGRLNVAFGTEYRRESYQILAGEPDSYGDGGVPNQAGGRAAIGAQVFPGFRPSNEVDQSRHSVAGYVDVEGDVARWLRLGMAGRAEHYSDFGNTVDGKLTVRAAAVSAAGLSRCREQRVPGAFARAVVLLVHRHQLRQPRPGPGPGGVADPAGGLGGGEGARRRAAQAGAVDQRQRRRGRDADGRRSPSTVDYYHVDIDDRIVLSGNFTAPPIAALLAPFGANSARFFTNAIDTRTSGVDVGGGYHVALDTAGMLFLRAGYNNTQTQVVGAVATPPQLAAFASVLFDRIEQRRLECGQPGTACGSAATGAGTASGPASDGTLRRVLQLHAAIPPTTRSTAPSG